MSWFSKKRKDLPVHASNDERSDQLQNIETLKEYTPIISREDIEFEDKMAQRAFDRNYTMGKLQAGLAVTQQGLQTIEKVADVWRYSKMVEQNIAQIQGATTIELAKISSKFQNQQTALMGIFGQRQQGLSGQFSVLEKAMRENDRELIVEALRGISTIVTSSPLEDFEKLAKAWEDSTKPLELDF